MSAQAERHNIVQSGMAYHLGRGLREGAFLLLLAVALYFLMALLTYSANDPGWSFVGPSDSVANAGGRTGAWFADVSLYLFGLFAYLVPVMVAYSGWMVFKERNPDNSINTHLLIVRWIGFFVTLFSGTSLSHMYIGEVGQRLPMGAGGILGDTLGEMVVTALGMQGATLIVMALFLAGFTLFSGLSWLQLVDRIGAATLYTAVWLRKQWKRLAMARSGRKLRQQRVAVVKKEKRKVKARKAPRIEPVVRAPVISKRVEKERQVPLFENMPDSDLPPLALLDEPPPPAAGHSAETLKTLSRLVELKLRDFKIEAQVMAIHPGPVVTLLELSLAPGTKASKVTGVASDLARALSKLSVRVVEVIPGKSHIGLEIPNETREIVVLSEILRSEEYEQAKSPLTIAMGKDISGNPVTADLAKMPHALIAGTTGSGKSVAINAMILSLLFKATPKQVRLIMIDPKMLELSVYEGIPHLLTPVVTDMKQAANALRWCVGEMERRYQLMAALGVRNLAGYNRKLADARKAGQPLLDPLFKAEEQLTGDTEPLVAPELEPMPMIVVVIDELADMMMVVGKKVEQLIARLAQKARAAGVHLLLATQRPSVDVLTGLIKANIPTRLAFQVSSRIDSRTVLDQMGAEQLLGHGDSLFLPSGTSICQRVHGAFVDDHEVHHVVSHLKKNSQPQYLDEILQEPKEAIPGLADSGGDSEDMDHLYDEAVAIVTKSRRASISGVQRRLKIGYNRAARMIEEMERTGVVSSPDHGGGREVLAPPPPKD
ncbi:MAG: DNA translocase FtsK 4TM domain-containing protein [gamma proteobacterium symbiont of Bathyaustriella thionipta]|nr:DNA translocase FtsK 4TM domain-containing protein [gamma proteobacterium symbiont of Bathyaustriella thionipta]